MKKIRVLQVVGSLRVGGLETVGMNLYRYIDREKYSFDYLVYGDEIEFYEEEVVRLGGRVIHIPKPANNYFKFFLNICSVIKKEGPYDIIHSHTLFNSGINILAARLMNVPKRIVHSHDNLSHMKCKTSKRIYNKVMRKILKKNATHFLACSKDAGNYLLGEDFFSLKGKVLLNGIDIDKFEFSFQERERIREEFNISDKIVIGNVGRLEDQKNHKFLIETFHSLCEQENDYILLLVGEGKNKEYLEKMIIKLGLSDKVILTGKRTDINSLMCAMDIFVFPSIHEGLGIVLIEAQANGLPCIVPAKVVPMEAKITSNFKFIEKFDTSQWIEVIKLYPQRASSQVDMNDIKRSGYALINMAKNISEIYNS
ncbi:glycosyltransferase family 1 protein [Turicibacter bilis]|uniref:glycosyltransferase family 1 protein n=1 Tax=Turicibacter bilis TaxID=2735723 RepID=UPI0031BB2889